MLITKYRAMKDMIPDGYNLTDKRTKRAPLDIIGDLSKSLFGLATQEDLKKVVRHMNKMVETIKGQNGAFKQTMNDLS